VDWSATAASVDEAVTACPMALELVDVPPGAETTFKLWLEKTSPS
jgi:hypothetical protein